MFSPPCQRQPQAPQDDAGSFQENPLKIMLNLLDLLLVLLAAWFVVPPALLNRIVHLPLPFDNHIASSPTLANLLGFLALLILRFALGRKNARGTCLTRAIAHLPAAWQPAIAGLVSLFVFLGVAQRGMWPTGDSIPAKLVPISLLEEGNLDLNEFLPGIPRELAYGIHILNGRALAGQALSGRALSGQAHSAYPLGTSFSVLPVYAAYRSLFPDRFAQWRETYRQPGGDQSPLNIANRLERISAAVIAALCVVLFWLLAEKETTQRQSLVWFSVAFALGTSMSSTAVTGLWQHGPGCLFVLLTLWMLRKAESGLSGWLIGAGLSAAWAYWCRPTTLFITATFAVYVLITYRARALYFLIPCAMGGFGAIAFNQWMFGNPTGGYAGNMSLFVTFDPAVALAHLASPSRGLLLFSPFLAFAVIAGIRRLRKFPLDWSSFCLYAAMVQLVLFSCWRTWTAGSAFGPRYLCEAAMLLCVAMTTSLSGMSWVSWKGRTFAAMVLFSCLLHLTGGSQGDRGWTANAYVPDSLENAWNLPNSQIAWTLEINP